MKFLAERFTSKSLLVLATLLAFSGRIFGAEEAGDRWGSLLEIGRAANLLVVVAVLVYVARKPLAHFLTVRSQTIRDQLAEAQKARVDAEARLNEINARMSGLEEELVEMKTAAEKEAREEYQRLTAAADHEADKILERARLEIDGLTRAAQLELKAHAAELSIQLAQDRIRSEMTEDDQRRLFARFVARVGGRE